MPHMFGVMFLPSPAPTPVPSLSTSSCSGTDYTGKLEELSKNIAIHLRTRVYQKVNS